jgi:guanylate kinase
MRGLLLTGPTGVGKSTAQAVLREQHGFWVPRTCTTRTPEAGEPDLLHFPADRFLEAVRSGEIVLPASFGQEWYGWLTTDLNVLRQNDGRAVLNVRPYAALMLQALLPDFVAVWLTVDDQELSRRRSTRLAARDSDGALRQRRVTQDNDDLVYRPCFAHVYMADARLISNLLALIP